jgi:hypothetical protein
MGGLVLCLPFIEFSNDYPASLLLCSNFCVDWQALAKDMPVARPLNFDTGPHVKQSFDTNVTGPG